MSKKGPTVSVVIPTYNRAYLVGRAIQSVLNQTYRDFQLIVVDDVSTDDTAKVVKEFQRKDERVSYILHDSNRGQSAARNTGIKNACGVLLSFLDSDDQWLPHKLENEVNILNEHADCVICSTGHSFINETTGSTIKSNVVLTQKQFVSQKDALRGECFTTNDFTVIKKVAESIGGFDETLPARVDWDFWIRVTSVGLGIQAPLITVKKYVLRSDQISTGLERKLEGTKILLEKHRDLFLKDLQAYRKVLYSIGLMYVLKNDSNAESYLRKTYDLGTKTREKLKLAIMLATIKILGSRGIFLMSEYYTLRYPRSYLLW